MAFPASAAGTTTNIGAAATPHTVNLPASLAAGDLVVCLFRNNQGTNGVSFPTGWIELKDVNAGGTSADRAGFAYKKLQTGDAEIGASTMSVTPGANSKAAYITMRITGAGTPEISADTTGSSTTPDPPSFTPSGGAQDYLWLWAGTWEGEQTSPPASNPTNYALYKTGQGSGTAGNTDTNVRVAIAGRELNAATENPPSWTISATDDWLVWTVAIPPAGSQSISITSVTAPNTAQALDPDKSIAAFTSATQPNTSQALNIDKSVSIAPATVLTQAGRIGQFRELVAAVVANVAQALTFDQPSGQSFTITPVTVAMAAQTLTRDVVKTLGAAVVASAAQALVVTKPIFKTLTAAGNTITSVALVVTKPIRKTLTAAGNTITSVALVVTKPIRKTLTAAVSTMSAIALVVRKPINKTVTPATQPNLAQILVATKPIKKTLTPAVETDFAWVLSIPGAIRVTIVPASLVSTAQTLDADKRRGIVAAVSSNVAVALPRSKSKSLTAAGETNIAQTLDVVHTIIKAITPATTTNTALPLVFQIAGLTWPQNTGATWPGAAGTTWPQTNNGEWS